MTNPSKQDKLHRQATAYVFGELGPKANTEFENQLATSASLRKMVDSIREAVGALENEFQTAQVSLPEPARIVVQNEIAKSNLVATASGANVALDPRQLEVASDIGSASKVMPWRAWGTGAAVAASVLILAGLTLPPLFSNSGSSQPDLNAIITQAQAENSQLLKQRDEVNQALAAMQTSQADLLSKIQELQEQIDRRPVAGPVELVDQNAISTMDYGSQPEQNPGQNGGQSELADDQNSAENPTKLANNDTGQPSAQPSVDVPAKDDSDKPFDVNHASRPDLIAQLDANRDDVNQDIVGVNGGLGSGKRSGALHVVKLPAGFGLEQIAEASHGDRVLPFLDNQFESVTEQATSTFSIDVDTAAYSKVRMYLQQLRRLPPVDAVRIEELINYFDYDYPIPGGDHPFSASIHIASCPWQSEHRLARVGIRGKDIHVERASSNLVFLLDVSSSMNDRNKLPLVIDGMKQLVQQLNENDSVAIVVYAGGAGLVLDSTSGDQKQVIVDALSRLRAGEAADGAQGIELAYKVAQDSFIDGGTNRVVLCTDGDFGVGLKNTEDLIPLVEKNAQGNIFLSVLGYGIGNRNDAMMEQISNKGNGNYAFVDTEAESRKVLARQMHGATVTIAKDVNVQVEFNPAEVESYRLIGYENRVLTAADFDNDHEDTSEIGAGHTVTALYEIKPKDKLSKESAPLELRYQEQLRLSTHAQSGEFLTLKVKYKPPTSDTSTLVEFPAQDSGQSFREADRDFQFAAAVAAFGMLLRDSPFKGDSSFDSVEELASAGAVDDRKGYRTEFLRLIKRAKAIRRR